MKNLKIWSLAVVLLMAMVACKPSNNTEPTPVPKPDPTIKGNLSNIEKEWKLVSVNGIENDFHVYISFSEGYFAMYQQVYTLDFKFYEGNYEASGQKLSGKYLFVDENNNDVYEPWKCSYIGGISEDGNTMTLKSNEEAPLTCVYEACTIPEDVKDEAIASTRSVEFLPFL